MTHPARLAVFASGSGTNLQALLDHFNASIRRGARVELVVGSRPGIRALARAEEAGVAHLVIDPQTTPPESLAGDMLAALAAHRIDLVVLAGYLTLIPTAIVDRYRGRMLNVHPALLPAFGGAGMFGIRVHRAVIEAGARVSGATVHLVGERYDEGPILAQWPVPVLPTDTPEQLAARVLRVEHLLLPLAIERLIAGQTPPRSPDSGEIVFELSGGTTPAMQSVRRLHG